MIRKPSAAGVSWINFGFYIGCLQAIVFLIQSALYYYEGLSGEGDHPDYSYHSHHLCHSFTYVFGFVLAWYGLLMVLILLDKYVNILYVPFVSSPDAPLHFYTLSLNFCNLGLHGVPFRRRLVSSVVLEFCVCAAT